MKKTRLVVTAPRGHLDQLVIKVASAREDIQIVGAVGTPGRSYIGQDVGIVAGLGNELGAVVYDDVEKIIDDCDMVVDCSTPAYSLKVMESCVRHGKKLICGTSGFTGEEHRSLERAGEKIPMMWAGNTSYVVILLKKLIAEASTVLGNKCKIEIIDYHSESKIDKPSGTAIEIAKAISNRDPNRSYEDITFHSIRAGNTPSSHRIVFGCMGEKLEFVHDVYDWECFAIGLCDAVSFMARQSIGYYVIDDMIEA